jgi:hypothetical protein
MKRLILIITFMFLLMPYHIFAQDFCKGDFNYDGSVGAEDVTEFLNHFGRSQFNNPCPPDGPTPVPKTGQTTSFATGDDGDLERGVALVTPRFADNGDGTITDNQTGLIWLKDANCFGDRTWNDALSDCNGLASGSCGLTDGSNAGDWMLPNRRELQSLVDVSNNNPSLPSGHPFYNVVNAWYWSSTTLLDPIHEVAYYVHMMWGEMSGYYKSSTYWVWCVRGGH